MTTKAEQRLIDWLSKMETQIEVIEKNGYYLSAYERGILEAGQRTVIGIKEIIKEIKP